jgi:hypothetical protein
VLAVELEFMAGVGVGRPPVNYRFTWYKPDELAGEPQGCVDTARIARDVERLTGIPASVADRIFESELDFLQLRGLA